jgi:hypothetical protein
MLHILIGRALNVDAGVAASEAEMRAAILPWKIRGLQRAGACSKPATSSLATKRRRSNAQSAVNLEKLTAATGTLAGAFKKAGAAPTAAAMSVLCLLLALIAAGVGKF